MALAFFLVILANECNAALFFYHQPRHQQVVSTYHVNGIETIKICCLARLAFDFLVLVI